MANRPFTSEAPTRPQELEMLISVLQHVNQQLSKLSANPLRARKQIEEVERLLAEAGFNIPPTLSRTKDLFVNESIRASAEFWGAFVDACSKEGWSVVGNTDRRLVHRAVFVVLQDDLIRVEGINATLTPHVPEVLKSVAEELHGIDSSGAGLQRFITAVAESVDALAQPRRECSLELLYRHCVLNIQKPSFWKSPKPSQFTVLTRPAFRFYISEAMRLGLGTSDGRRIVLGTTSTGKDAWEIYSPGEERVIVAGRLRLEVQDGR